MYVLQRQRVYGAENRKDIRKDKDIPFPYMSLQLELYFQNNNFFLTKPRHVTEGVGGGGGQQW